MSSRVWIRRAYAPATHADGHRVLIDRLWPRGITKTELHIDTWMRDLAPSDDLRHWFGHDPARWEEFRTRYRAEIANQTGAAAREYTELVQLATTGRVTLVFAARDTEHNNAVVVQELLDDQLKDLEPKASRE